MPVQRSHGRDYPAAPRPDELPVGMPVDAGPASPSDRGERGQFAGGNSLAVMGGRAKAGRSRLAVRLGLSALPTDSAFAPYRASANAFRRAQCGELSRNVGGGVCGPGPSSLVASAALQLAWSRYLSDQAAMLGDADMALQASRLADASRNNLLSAHELCAREATARATANPVNVHDLVFGHHTKEETK